MCALPSHTVSERGDPPGKPSTNTVPVRRMACYGVIMGILLSGPVPFLQGENANKNIREEKLNQTIQTIKGDHDLFKSKGTRFGFFLIKEESSGKRRVFLKIY